MRNRPIFHLYPNFQKRHLFFIFLNSKIFICAIQSMTTFFVIFSFWRKFSSEYKLGRLDCSSKEKICKKMHRTPEHRINAWNSWTLAQIYKRKIDSTNILIYGYERVRFQLSFDVYKHICSIIEKMRIWNLKTPSKNCICVWFFGLTWNYSNLLFLVPLRRQILS